MVLALFGGLYAELILLGPQGIHFIRQTDTLSLVAHFRSYSSDLFEPGILDLLNAPDEGRSAGEFPLVYWLLGMIERLTGPLPFLLKWVGMASMATGVAQMMLATAKLLNDEILGYALVLMVFSSSVVVHYTGNYLPDPLALGLVLWGWARILPDLALGRLRKDHLVLALWCLATLLKATMGLSLVVWFLLWCVMSFRERPFPWAYSSAILMTMVVAGSWHIYARWYNATHGTAFFMTSAAPIWNMDPKEIASTLSLMMDYWWSKYLHPSVWHVFLVLLPMSWVLGMRWTRSVIWSVLLMQLAAIAFILLFFRKFADHDYYFLTLLPAVMLTCVLGVFELLRRWPAKPLRWVLRAVFVSLAIAGLVLSRTELNRRLHASPDNYGRWASINPQLSEVANRIDPHATMNVVVLGDSSSQGALMGLGRRGWTYPGYPIQRDPPERPDGLAGATHVLVLGRIDPAFPTGEVVAEGRGWRLYGLSRP